MHIRQSTGRLGKVCRHIDGIATNTKMRLETSEHAESQKKGFPLELNGCVRTCADELAGSNESSENAEQR